MQPRISKLAVASMIVVISYVTILCVIVTSKSILLGTLGKLAILIFPALAILAIVLGAQSKKHIKRSEGSLTGSRWASTGLIAGVLLAIVALQVMISLPAYIAYTKRGYDADVKSKLKNAAKAQAAYYRDNGSYAANIDSLPGFNQSHNVAIAVEATAITFVISGAVTKGCEASTGTWHLDGTTGAIDGTPCR